jgi:isoleucyl-tRNA synthetase
MTLIREICEQGNMVRKTNNISTRQPLSKATISTSKSLSLSPDLTDIVKNELNVKKIDIIVNQENLKVELDTQITPELKSEGDMRDLIRQIQSLRKEMNLDIKDKINIFAPNWPQVFESEILKRTLGISINQGDTLKIEKA